MTYRENPAISQSFLKCILNNNFKQPEDIQVGSLVDSLIFKEPHNYVVGESIPQPYVSAFKKDQSEWLETVRKLEYYNNWGDSTHLKKMEQLFPFWEQNKDKLFISQSDWNTAEQIVSFLDNSNLWKEKSQGEWQKELYGVEETHGIDYNIKGLLDIHNCGIIRDLKITGVTFDMFLKIARQLRYDIQGSFYKNLLIKNNIDYVKFEWLVYSIPEKRLICIEADENDLLIGEWGNEYIKGWRHALDLWHLYKDIGYFNPLFIGEQTKITLWQK